MTLVACFVLQIPFSERSDAPMPEIGIRQIEAQPIVEDVGFPLRVRIPAIAVDADVVEVGLTETGRLDVPLHAEDAGWYNLNPAPGEAGNAVLDGHLDIDGRPGVFHRLGELTIGQSIFVTDDAGVEREFRIERMVVYDVFNAPMEEIFGGSDAKNLNLITCAGTWREELDHYDKRLIVYSTLVE